MTDLVPREFSFNVGAERDLVWEALTTADGLASWYVAQASVDPTVGGHLEVDWGTGSYAMGTFDIVNPHDRIRLIYGGPETGTEDWLLSTDDDLTHVMLIHSLPVAVGETWDGRYADIVRGWLLFHSTLIWVAGTVGKLGRRSEVRLGSITDGAWHRILAALGLAGTPTPGSVIEISGLPPGEVLVAVDRFSLLIAFDDRATLLVDVEGSTLYTLIATYGDVSEESRLLEISLTNISEQLCAVAGAGSPG
jgi:uncharacterized protein YndB with AHSA1/START domain